MRRATRAFFLILIAILLGCSGTDQAEFSSNRTGAADPKFQLPPTTAQSDSESNAYHAADLRVLFIGNSHTSMHRMPKTVQRLLNARPGKKQVAYCRICTGASFLTYHATRRQTLNEITRHKWDFVVLQSQKYSTTGRYSYPIDGALKLAKLARENGAQVIMYPEWARRDHPEETIRILTLHQRIADQSEARVAPVGQAWARAFENQPDLQLHAPDGNHASALGAFLTASVFFCVLCGEDLTELPQLDGVSLDPQQQRDLRQVAWETFKQLESGDD